MKLSNVRDWIRPDVLITSLFRVTSFSNFSVVIAQRILRGDLLFINRSLFTSDKFTFLKDIFDSVNLKLNAENLKFCTKK